MKISPAVRAAIAAGTSAGVVMSLMLLGSGGDDTVRIEQSSSGGAVEAAPDATTTSMAAATTTTTAAEATSTSSTSTPPPSTTTQPPTTTTTVPPTTTTTVPAPAVSLTFTPGAAEAKLEYTTSRNYDASICVRATLADGTTRDFTNSFRGFAPPSGFFSVMWRHAIGDVTVNAVELVGWNFAPPSYDPLPHPCPA